MITSDLSLSCSNLVRLFEQNKKVVVVVTLLLRVNDEFDGIWTSCGLRRRFRSCYGGFGFYSLLDIMTKMVWSQGGHTVLFSDN